MFVCGVSGVLCEEAGGEKGEMVEADDNRSAFVNRLDDAESLWDVSVTVQWNGSMNSSGR